MAGTGVETRRVRQREDIARMKQLSVTANDENNITMMQRWVIGLVIGLCEYKLDSKNPRPRYLESQ